MRAVQLELAEVAPTPEHGAGPTPEQRRAIEARDRDVLLEAGAGTGQDPGARRPLLRRRRGARGSRRDPRLHVHRAGGRRASTPDPRTELAARAAHAEGERAELLAKMSRDSERAWISTIHGFCRRLLASHPVAVGLDPRFRVLDEPEADRVAAKAFDEALEALLSAGDREIARLVAAVRIGPLRELVRTAHDELRSLGRPGVALPDPRPSDPGAAVGELAAAARAALDETTESRAGSRQPRPDRDGRRARPELAPGRVRARRARAQLERAAFAGPACRRYREAWRAARRAVVERDTAELYGTCRSWFAASGNASRRSRRSARASTSRTSSSRRCACCASARHRRCLPGALPPRDGRRVPGHERAPARARAAAAGPDTRVFAVGDEFQSIYGFRHADLRVFRRERERIRAQADDRARCCH